MGEAPTHSTSYAMRMLLCALAVQLSVSANLLTWAGIPYVTEGGGFPFKIHPGTYLICIAFMLNCATRRRARELLPSLLGTDSCLGLYLGAIFASILYALATTGGGNVVVLLDTFLPAGLAAVILRTASRGEICTLRRLLQWGIALNAALALGEASLHTNLVPLYLNGTECHTAVSEYRPTALYDHPLTGGVMTMMGLALAPERAWLRSAYMCLLAATMLAFGGRVAVIAAILSWFLIACTEIGKYVLSRDARASTHIVSFLLVCMGCLIIALTVFCAGLGARLAGHIYWDPSAQVRIAQWSLLGELTIPQIVFGTSRNDVLSYLNPLWLSDGVEVIENFWLLMFVSLGVVGFCIFLPGFMCLLGWCWRRAHLRGRVLLVAVVCVASASNSLGRKSTLLVSLIASTICSSLGERRPARMHGPGTYRYTALNVATVR